MVFDDIQNRLKAATEECARLAEENRKLKRLLGIPEERHKEQEKYSRIENQLSPEDKVALFRSIFRGRDDVYPVRWENREGRSGYSPVCANEWKRPLCGKPQVKCHECLNRELVPVSDEVIQSHLAGKNTIGVYPLLTDETCWFLAVDFDKDTWKEDADAFLKTCDDMSIPAALERSRSGNGGHVWIFFEAPIQAALARKLGSAILTYTMEKHRQMGLDSYDRFFPNQDTMPKGGFGNLIALPLQKNLMEKGNMIFLDRDFKPYPDQWEYLSSVKRMRRDNVEAIVNEAQRKGKILGVRISFTEEGSDDPWTLPPSKKKLEKTIEGPLPEKVGIVTGQVKARYVVGLTATPVRKDGHHPIIIMQCGHIRFRGDIKKQALERPFEHVVIPRHTGLRIPESAGDGIHSVYTSIMEDSQRNDLIFDDLLKTLEEGRSPLFLTERTEHLAKFSERLKGFAKNVIVLKGGMGKKQLRSIMEQMASIPADEERVIIATGRYIGEGFDDARLDTLFLAMPISWRGTLQQYAGRLHRLHDNKKIVRIYDYVDSNVPMLMRMYKKRLKGYQAIGYSVHKEDLPL
jgi:hypothetical protein